MALGLGAVFVARHDRRQRRRPADKAGLAAALLNASQQLGGALGLAIFTGVATARTNDLLAAGRAGGRDALTAGFQRALLVEQHLPRRRRRDRAAHREHARRRVGRPLPRARARMTAWARRDVVPLAFH